MNWVLAYVLLAGFLCVGFLTVAVIIAAGNKDKDVK